MTRSPTTYWDYIKVEQLLSLQTGIAETEKGLSNDEVLFLVVHQIDELWFKLIVRELVSVRDLFAKPEVPEQSLASAVRGLRRIDLLLRTVADHFALMETLTTRDYLGFRDKLSPASGFQSAQMREIEILLGLDEQERVPLGHEQTYMQALRSPDGSESPASRRVAARLGDMPTLRDAVGRWVYRTPIHGSMPSDAGDAEVVREFVESYCAAHANVVMQGMERVVVEAMTAKDAERLKKRFENEIASAKAFLLAEEVPENERAAASRRRAALVFIESYRELPLLAWPREVVDTLVALEQAFVLFRQRHARMVERVIGRRTGTGGSAGVDYLDQTALKYRIFREMWAVRTLLVKESALPPVKKPEFYGFAGVRA